MFKRQEEFEPAPEYAPASSAHAAGCLQKWPAEMRTFLLVSGTLLVLSALDALIRWPRMGAKAAWGALFLMFPLYDLKCYQLRWNSIHQAAFFGDWGQPWTYPAPSAFIYGLLYKTHFPVVAYFVLLAVGLSIAIACFIRSLLRAGLKHTAALSFALLTGVLSFPIYFSMERGNIEGFLWLGLALTIALLVHRRWDLAALCLGVIAAFKIYPILFFALYLPKRRWTGILLGAVAALALTALGLYYIDHHLAESFRLTREGVNHFVKLYSGSYDQIVIGYDHSAWAPFKVLTRHHPKRLATLLRLYTPVAGLLATAIFIFGLWKAPRFNQVLALCTFMVLLPPTSFEYTLQALYIPLGWLCILVVRRARVGLTLEGARAMMVAFGLLLAPATFIRTGQASYGGPLKAFVLMAMLYLAVRYPMPDSEALPSTSHPV